MKQFLRHIFFLLALFMATTNVWAECYVLNESAIVEHKGNNKTKEYTLSGPGNKLKFQAKRSVTGVGTLRVDQYVNGKWENIYDKNPGKVTNTFIGIETEVDYEDYELSISRYATKLKFYTQTISYSKFYKNLTVSWATYVDAPMAGGAQATEWNAWLDIVGKSASASATIDWSNTNFTWELFGDTDQFSVDFSSTGATCDFGTAKVTATYHRTKPGKHSAKLEIYTVSGTYVINFSGETGRYIPQAAKKMDVVMNESYNPSDIFDVYYLANNVKNTISDYTVKALDPTIANYVGGKIVTNYQTGTARFQLTREADTNFDALNTTISVNVNPAGGCVLFETNKNEEYKIGYYDNSDGFLFDLGGIGNELTVDLKKQDTGAGRIHIIGYTADGTEISINSVNGGDLSTSWTTHTFILPTDNDITKIRIKPGNDIWNDALNKYFRNVQVTRKTYLRPSTTELTLPQTNIGKSSEKTFDLSWSTCSDDIKLVSNNDLFEVGTTQINAADHTGTTNNILVRFKGANEPGTYSAVITIYDQSQSKEVKVSCVVKDRLATKIVYTGKTLYSEAQDCIEGKFSVEDENGNTVTGANIVLTSSNEDILSICGNAGFMPHCGGSVTLTATYAGDDTHESCSLSVALTVSYCQREIIWETSYLNFATDKNGYIDDKRVLDATINPESEITYQLHTVTSTPFAEIVEEGGEYFVRVFGEGHGYLVAIANECSYEGRMYEATYKIKEIRVSGAGACDPNSLLIWGDGRDEPFVYQFSTNSSERTRIYDLKGLPAETMTFGAHAESASWNSILVISFSTESEGDNWIGEHEQEVVAGSSYNWNYSCPVPAGAKRVRFQSKASLTIYFNGVTIPQQTYIRPSVESIEISDAIVNVPFERTFSVDYSNVRLLQWKVSDNHDLGLKVVANQEVNNDCDLYGTYTFTLTGESPYPQDVTETITFFTSAGDEVKIPVTITATLSEPFYFNVQDGDMAVSTNWTYNGSNTHGLLPDKRFPIIVSQAMTINEGELVAYGVTIENGGSVNIQPKGGLTLHAGGFTNVTENNFEVHNKLEGAGFVRVSKYFKKLGGTMPKMKVHFTTKANMNNGENKNAA
mgnify:CR=1 FL=1